MYRICLFFFFLLLYGVRSRFFGVTAEIENNYILCYPFGVCGFNRRSLKSGMWTTDLRTGSPPKICKNSHRAESCGANVFFPFPYVLYLTQVDYTKI